MNQSDYCNLVSQVEHLKESVSQMNKNILVYVRVTFLLVNKYTGILVDTLISYDWGGDIHPLCVRLLIDGPTKGCFPNNKTKNQT